MKIHQDILSEEGKKPISYDIRWEEEILSNKDVILFVHGFKGFKDWGIWSAVADSFAKAGFVFLKINLSYNGTTPENLENFVDLEAFGNNNFSHEINDIKRVINALQLRHIPIQVNSNLKNVNIIGHSKGGASVVIAANEIAEIKKIITWAAIDDVAARYGQKEEEWKNSGVKYYPNARTKQEMPVYYQIVEDIEKNKDRFDLKLQLEKLDKPLLICHGDNDPTVHVDAAYQLKSWSRNSELCIVEGANHVFNGTHPYLLDELPKEMEEVLQATINFIKNT